MRSPVRDGCPECMAPTEPKAWQEWRGQISAFYECRRCGHVWRCSWGAAALGPGWRGQMVVPEAVPLIEIRLAKCLLVLSERELLSLLGRDHALWKLGLQRGKASKRAARFD